MSDTNKPKNRWFLKAELAVLFCVACIWIIKLVIIDIDKTAAAVLKQVVKISPNNATAHYLLGAAYSDLSCYEDAIKAHKKAIRIDPHDADIHESLGDAYFNLGEYEQAIEAYKNAIRIDPDYTDASENIGNAYYNLEKYEQAIEAYKEAIRIDPNDEDIHESLGDAYFNLGEYEQAIEAYAEKCQYDRAISDFTKAIEINPRFAEAYFNRGNTFIAKGQSDQAISDLTVAVKRYQEDKSDSNMNQLAWLYATCPLVELRNGQKAVELAKKACELSKWKNHLYVDTLAAAYAEIRDFESAVNWQENAIVLLIEENRSKYEGEYKNRLKLYQSGKPYYDPWPLLSQKE